MELVISIAFGACYVVTGIAYWYFTKDRKGGDRK